MTKNLFTGWRDGTGFYPKQDIPVIGLAGGSGNRLMIPAKWGLVSNHYSDPGQQPQPFNARADTVVRYDTFCESFEQRRCLIPPAGFCEWTQTRPKVRCRLAPTEGLFGVAGIFDVWEADRHPKVISAAMVTTDANDLIGAFHDRCPAILTPEGQRAWLDPDADVADLLKLLVPWPSEWMTKTEAPPKPRAKTEPAAKVQRSAARRSKQPQTPGLFDAG